jgi:flagellar biosynthesis/type III secretory pathway ATPase
MKRLSEAGHSVGLHGLRHANADEAIAKIDKVNAFLRQGLSERPAYAETLTKLAEAVA